MNTPALCPSFHRASPQSGEKHEPGTLLAVVRGSPPRRRGKDKAITGFHSGQRITPARAGKRSGFPVFLHVAGDHPRVGGEKGCCKFSSRNHSGSPPRGRGKDYSDCAKELRFGITPAWAGKSPRCWALCCCALDHPRMGGEKTAKAGIMEPQAGSHPHGRGKVPSILADKGRPGITPAWAGKRHINVCKVCVSEDHPRMGGEKRYYQWQGGQNAGSPPRGRGKARHLSHGLLPCG